MRKALLDAWPRLGRMDIAAAALLLAYVLLAAIIQFGANVAGQGPDEQQSCDERQPKEDAPAEILGVMVAGHNTTIDGARSHHQETSQPR